VNLQRPDVIRARRSRVPAISRNVLINTWAVAGPFLLSGASGLIYQTVWLRRLSDLRSHGIRGRLAEGTRSPLGWYGVVEISIGLLALATPLELSLVSRTYPWVSQQVSTSSFPQLLRFALAFSILAVPTSLVGASFPLIMKATLVGDENGSGCTGSDIFFRAAPRRRQEPCHLILA
jgi:hypothetical protein